MFNAITWLEICSASVIVYIIQRIAFKRSPAPLPPGPRPLPLVGNLFDIPRIKPWLTYAQWGEKYGDITRIQVLGQHIILLNSIRAAIEMFDKKGAKYSDRPVLPMAGDLLGCKDGLPMLTYGDRLREIRRHFHCVIGTHTAMEAYYDIKAVEIHKFLKRILADPEQLVVHIRMTVGAIVLRISYGYQVEETNDYIVDLSERVASIFSKATAPGAFLVDSIPILKYVPEWVPGAGFKRKAREWRVVIDEQLDRPYQFVKNQMEAGIAPKSYISALLDNRSLNEEQLQAIKWSAASFYGAGSDTTVSAIHSMFLAMTLFPEVQKKAQAEIDAIIGLDRLPTLSDRQSLPYIEALVKEIHRWHVVLPLVGFPHRVSEDDIHNGYYIPKGSLVIPNQWSMLHDPHYFSEPMEFRPERFLVHEGKQPECDPRTICFGFGRRACPGSLLADGAIWLLTAMSLAVFDITKAVENGKEITPEVDPSSELASHPKPFKCTIQPRTTKALELIQQDALF
ncbi:cytochrome P450 [Scleroderma citrinum]